MSTQVFKNKHFQKEMGFTCRNIKLEAILSEEPAAATVRSWQVFTKAEDIFHQKRLRKMFKINYPLKKDVVGTVLSARK